MSLFHCKDWWSHKAGFASECSPHSMLVSNIDNDASNADKLITGSFTGHLRIFAPSNPPKIEDLLLETNLEEPILQIEAGRFVAGTSRLALAVLFPKKLCVYLVNSIRASQGGGPSYLELSLSYTHRFQHHAYSFAYGPFGSSSSSSSSTSSRDHICVMTLDGQLLFFEADTFAFSRFLPGFLLPGAFVYVRAIDSFVLSSAANELECYRYSVLGESAQGGAQRKGGPGADDGESEEESKEAMMAEFKQVSNSKKLHTDWTLNLGEHVLDIQCGRISRDPKATADIVVLSKHTVWLLKDSGAVRHTRRLEYSPLSLCVFPTQMGFEHVLIGSEEQSLFLYSDMQLVWAARTTVSPVTVRVAPALSPSVAGLICCHSDTNEAMVCYLGTDPPLQAVSTAQSKELDYDGMDTEHRRLLKVVRQAAGDRMQEPKDKLIIKAQVAPQLREDDATDIGHSLAGRELQLDDRRRPVCADVRVVLSHTALLPMNNVHVTLALPAAFVTPEPAVFVASLPPASSSSASTPFILSFPVYLLARHHVHSLAFDVLVSYMTPDNLTRTGKADGRLPLSAYGRLRPPVKNTAFFFTLDCNRSPPALPTIFPDLFDAVERSGQGGGVTADNSSNVISLFTWGWNEDVTVLVSKKTGRYRVQSSVYHAFAVLMHDLVSRILAYHQDGKHNDAPAAAAGAAEDGGSGALVVKFEEDLPFNDFFQLLESHHAQRLVLSSLYGRVSRLSLQFRAVQKRLLVRYKDKNPQPLLSFDVLMEESYASMMDLTEHIQREEAAMTDLSERLASATSHLVLLLTLKYQLDRKNAELLRQLLHSQGAEERGAGSGLTLDGQGGSGWEERVDVALIHTLKFILTKTATAAGGAGSTEGDGGGQGATQHTEVIKDIGRVKKHLIMLTERLQKGMRLVLQTKEGASGVKALQSPGTPPASASGARRDERRRQGSVDLREASQTLVEVEEEEG